MRLVARAVAGGVVGVAALALGGATLTQSAGYSSSPGADEAVTSTFVPVDPFETMVPGRELEGIVAEPSVASTTIVVEGEPPREADGPGPVARPGPDGALPIVPAVDAGDFGISALVLEAYQRAADRVNVTDPTCGIRWQVLAGIGRVESRHANDGRVTAAGDAVPRILGPVLDGNGFASIGDSDGGRWDSDTTWDRAVGPMQFIPGTWAVFGADGSGDGVSDPNNVFDGTLAAARYLCHDDADLSTDAGLATALRRYNNSSAYVALVMRWIAAYESGAAQPMPDAGPGTEPVALIPAAAPPGGGGDPGPTPGPKPDPGPRPDPKPTGSPRPTPSETPTPTPTPSPTPSETPTPSPTPSETPTPTPTPSPTPSETPTPTSSPTPTGSPADPPTPTPTATDTPGPTPRETRAPSASPTPGPDPTP